MVKVFKTDVNEKSKAKNVLPILQKAFPHLKINFDLDDCDNILRVEGKRVSADKIILVMERQKYLCELFQ